MGITLLRFLSVAADLGQPRLSGVSNRRFVMAITASGEEWTQSSCPGGLGK
jgi:hypothetical protein